MMKLIVGLGNPGGKYENTRHNLGFAVVNKFLKDVTSANETPWSPSEKLKSDIAHVTTITGEKVIVAKPNTYMNNSGMAVSLIASFYKIEPDDIWIVYDELDLPVGAMKIRIGGAAAGHHGVESIIESLGTDAFWRFRLGIGVSHDKTHALSKQTIKETDDFVLGSFGEGEQGKIRELKKHGSDALQLALAKDLPTAMNRYNTK